MFTPAGCCWLHCWWLSALSAALPNILNAFVRFAVNLGKQILKRWQRCLIAFDVERLQWQACHKDLVQWCSDTEIHNMKSKLAWIIAGIWIFFSRLGLLLETCKESLVIMSSWACYSALSSQPHVTASIYLSVSKRTKLWPDSNEISTKCW